MTPARYSIILPLHAFTPDTDYHIVACDLSHSHFTGCTLYTRYHATISFLTYTPAPHTFQ